MAALVLFQMLSYQKLNKNSIDLENPFSVHAVMKSTILTTVNYQATSYPARNQSIENTLQNAQSFKLKQNKMIPLMYNLNLNGQIGMVKKIMSLILLLQLKNKLKKKLKKKSQLKELLMVALVLFLMQSYQKLNKNSIDLENPFLVLAVTKSTIHTTVNYQATSYPARNQSIENTLQNAQKINKKLSNYSNKEIIAQVLIHLLKVTVIIHTFN